jgi:predicted nucleic acid-binding protein
MTEFDRFDRNARSRGLLIDTNLIVLLIVGAVNRDRIPRFKRTTAYTAADWDLLAGIVEQVPRRYTLPHILAEVSALTDLKGPELDSARAILHNTITLMDELPFASADACASPYYRRLGLTDAAIVMVARQQGCSVLTNDSGLYTALSEEGASVVKFDHLRDLL